jgi:AcrR family transcriptional regulator
MIRREETVKLRDKERTVRRQHILDAAQVLFEKQGVEETSMEAIAAAAEYTRRTLYAYFRNRDEICLAIFTDMLAERWEMQQAAMARAKRGLDKVLAWGQAFFRFARQRPHALRLQVFWDYRGIDKRRVDPSLLDTFTTLNEEVIGGLRDAFLLGVEDGSLRPDLPVDMTISHYAYSLRTAMNKALFPSYSFARFKPNDYLRHYFTMLTRAIATTEVPTK